VRPDRRLVLVAAGITALVAIAITVVVLADDGKDPSSVATAATTTSTTTSTTSSSSSSTSVSTVPPTSTVPSRPTTPSTAIPTTAPARCQPPAPGSDFDGFGATEIVIENGQGSRRSCVLTADTPAQQQQGLMRQQDLDGYDGMIFRFPTTEERSFWMRNTSIPLSIAFFDGGGAFVSATDMEPCGDSPECPGYPSRGAAKFALEVIRGQLPAVHATGGSRLIA
jgi:uncharacterized membrane protein (UPF0127 family)